MNKENSVANFLAITGSIEIALGIILGLSMGLNENLYGGINWVVIFVWVIAGIFSGMLSFGLAEVIELLHNINLKLGNAPKSNGDEAPKLYEKGRLDKKDV